MSRRSLVRRPSQALAIAGSQDTSLSSDNPLAAVLTLLANDSKVAERTARLYLASRRRSTSVKPFGASACDATSAKCSAGFLLIRSASVAQPKKRRRAARATLTEAGFCRLASAALYASARRNEPAR